MSAEELIQLYRNAALCFARSVLWKDWNWGDAESVEAFTELGSWFRRKRDKEAAFINFCDRVIMGGILATFNHTTPLALWNSLLSTGGLPGNKDLQLTHQKISALRRKNPFFTTALPVLCKYYIHYLHTPSPTSEESLKRALDTLGYPDLMELFYDALKDAAANSAAA